MEIDYGMVELLERAARPHIWDERPVFCFTSDIDWASEEVIDLCLRQLPVEILKPTVFVTHKSEMIEREFLAGRIQRGIHPNFLPGSSHGESFREVVETCKTFAPEATCSRSHRAFDVTDTAHLLRNEYGIADGELLSAIEYHTTGRANMKPLEKLLFLADFTSVSFHCRYNLPVKISHILIC